MLKKLAALAIICSITAPAVAMDYVAQRKAAMELLDADKYEQALEAFLAMADGEVTPLQKSDALEQAVTCLIRLDRTDEAMKLTEQIPWEASAKTCRMRIMFANDRHQELIDTFGDADIESWPNYLKSEAYTTRGRAAYRAGNAELAEADWTKAIKWQPRTSDKADALNALGAVYRNLLKDDEKAIETYRKAQAIGGRYKGSRATMAISSILIKQERSAEALQEMENWLAKIDLDTLAGDWWPAQVRAAHARALAAAGRESDAIAKYEEALALDRIHPSIKARVEQAIQELRGTNAQDDAQAEASQ